MSTTRRCPRCDRPLGRNARNCLYCGERVSPSSDGLSTPMTDLPAVLMGEDDADDGESHWMVMMTPPVHDAADLTASVAPMVGADPFIVRQRLLRGRPFLVAGSLPFGEARRIQAGLAELHVPASCFCQPMLDAIPEPWVAVQGSLEEDHARLCTGDEEVIVPYAAVFLVVQGEVSERTQEVQRRDAPIAEVHSGVGQRVKHTVTDMSSIRRTRLLVDVYHTTAVEAVRLGEDKFRSPGGKLTSRENLMAFVRQLRERAPHEVFDASFGEMDAVNLVPRQVRRTGQMAEKQTSVSDNQDEFDAYSASLFLHVLKLRRAGACPPPPRRAAGTP